MVRRWDTIATGNLSRNRYWGELAATVDLVIPGHDNVFPAHRGAPR